MSDAITREEKLMEAIATGKPLEFEPITRKEKFLKKILEKVGGGGTGGGADWNASEGEAGYVKNRTHYEEHREIVTIVEEQTVSHGQEGFSSEGKALVAGENYIVTFDGVEYEKTAIIIQGSVVVGLTEMLGGSDPFMFGYVDGQGFMCMFADDAEHTFKITTAGVKVHKLDKKFLPDGVAGMADAPIIRLKLNNFSIRSIVDDKVRTFPWDAKYSYEDIFAAAKTGRLVLYDANGALSVTPSAEIFNDDLFVEFSSTYDADNSYICTLVASKNGYFSVNDLHKITIEAVQF